MITTITLNAAIDKTYYLSSIDATGIECVIVSLGEKGSVAGYNGFRIKAPKIKAVGYSNHRVIYS